MYCQAEAQVFIIEVAFRKTLGHEIQAQLARAALELFNECHKITLLEPYSKLIFEDVKIYLKNRLFFYHAFSHIK